MHSCMFSIINYHQVAYVIIFLITIYMMHNLIFFEFSPQCFFHYNDML